MTKSNHDSVIKRNDATFYLKGNHHNILAFCDENGATTPSLATLQNKSRTSRKKSAEFLNSWPALVHFEREKRENLKTLAYFFSSWVLW